MRRLLRIKLEDAAKADFTTPEQYIPAMGVGSDWEPCMIINRSRGVPSVVSISQTINACHY